MKTAGTGNLYSHNGRHDLLVSRSGEYENKGADKLAAKAKKKALLNAKRLTKHQKESVKLSKQRVGGTYGTFTNID